MASSGSSSYMIYHHENLNISNIFSILVFGRSLEGSDIVECGPQETKPESFLDNLITLITLILQRAMIWLSGPAALVGLIIEFTLNLFVLNGGIFGLPIRIITESLQRNDTQAFIFCDKPENAEMIVVAFRGTELFNLRDWATDIDLSWLNLGEMGKVHVGFMRALGFQKDAKDAQTGWPKENKGDKVLAYYTIKEKLRQLLEQNPNAKILVTGHSLGGALAILFPAILLYHQENSILDRLCGVYTFGQPRVGDRKFGYIMEKQLNGTSRRYYRVVYRYDIVPRVPPQWSLLPFAHFGVCIYYKSWYKAQISKEEPDKNYFNLLYFPSQYINAWFDLFRGLFAGIRHGKEFKEGSIPIGARLFGLLIPGLASHGPRDYVNGTRLGNIEIMEEDNI
ncbi:triacylglycerol lipase OBL1-like isoform X3 [Macadamia integrifolia]|uniref:triacylglycerol lipase OBL1-like isoform X3 n=1 Tax=Macadamia integrifolia TaxID=60698 RepID=UPI001C4FC3FC|nr:triacylglycerol lipase OBL1-like isoform X3 [Macadamia integrifolia]